MVLALPCQNPEKFSPVGYDSGGASIFSQIVKWPEKIKKLFQKFPFLPDCQKSHSIIQVGKGLPKI